MQQQYEYDASDWLDNDETSWCDNSKQPRKQSKKDWKENRREQGKKIKQDEIRLERRKKNDSRNQQSS